MPSRILLAAILLIAFVYCLPAQTAPVASVDALAKMLNRGTPKEKAEAANVLGWEVDDVQFVSDARAYHPKLDASQRMAVLEVPGSGGTTLVVFVSGHSGWLKKDEYTMDDCYEPATWEFKSTVRAPVVEIVVHGDCMQRGTGDRETRLVILKFFDGRLRAIFSTVENAVELGWPPGDPDHKTLTSIEFLPASKPDEDAELVTNTRLTDGRRRYRVERRYSYDEDLRAFLPSAQDIITPLKSLPAKH